MYNNYQSPYSYNGQITKGIQVPEEARVNKFSVPMQLQQCLKFSNKAILKLNCK